MADPAALLRDLLQSGQYSDLTLRCQQTTFKLHRAVVCPRSKVLAAAVGGNFKEASTGEIDLSADELPVIRAMIHYLYHNDYDETFAEEFQKTDVMSDVEVTLEVTEDPPSENELCVPPPPVEWDEPPNSLLFHSKMYIIADKYDISSLRDASSEKFQTAISGAWMETEFNELVAKAFCEVVELLWDNTMDSDTKLRNTTARAASSNISSLLDFTVFKELLAMRGDFALLVLKAGSGKKLDGEDSGHPWMSWGPTTWAQKKKKGRK